MSVWNKVSECIELRRFYKNHGALELKVAYAEWIEAEMNRIYSIFYESTNEQIVFSFHFNFHQQCHGEMRAQLQAFNDTQLFEIFSKGYEEEVREANIIENFSKELSTRLDQLKTNLKNFNLEVPFINDQAYLENHIEIFIAELKNISDLLIKKLKEVEKSQTIRNFDHRIKHHINDLERLFLEFMTLRDGLNELLAINNQIIDTEILKMKIYSITKELLASSFIIEKQPPQVIQTKTTISVNVRWVLGSYYKEMVSSNKTQCFVLSEQHAAQLHGGRCEFLPEILQNSSAGIIRNTSSYKHSSENTFIAQFKDMKIIRRPRGDRNQTVTEQKYTLLFLNSMTINGYQISEWTMSLPVVITVHSNQNYQAWATIIWDNTFSSLGRLPFEVPKCVSWDQMSVAIMQTFIHFTERLLTLQNLYFLRQKLYSIDPPEPCTEIEWSQLCELELPGTNFTFWKWLYNTIKLAKTSYLLDHWRAGHIFGFISKPDVEKVLSNQPNGTFLIRFAESSLGAITISCKQDDEIHMIEQWESNDLTAMNLDQRVSSLLCGGGKLKWLYNANQELIDVTEVFKDDRVTKTGYTPLLLQAKLRELIPKLTP